MPLLIIYTCAYPHGYLAPEPLRLPSGAEHAEVGFVTPLSVFLSGGEELVCLFRELFATEAKHEAE